MRGWTFDVCRNKCFCLFFSTLYLPLRFQNEYLSWLKVLCMLGYLTLWYWPYVSFTHLWQTCVNYADQYVNLCKCGDHVTVEVCELISHETTKAPLCTVPCMIYYCFFSWLCIILLLLILLSCSKLVMDYPLYWW